MAGGVPRRTTGSDQQRGGAHLDRFVGHRRGIVEIEPAARSTWQAVGGRTAQNSIIPRLWARAAPSGQVEVARVLPVAEATIVERVEDQLAREAEQVERSAAVLGEERPGGREVLPVHDLGRLDLDGTPLIGDDRRDGRTRPRGRAAALPDHRSGGARCRPRTRAVGYGHGSRDRRGHEPAGRLHDVGVGVVHDAPGRVVRHVRPPGPGRRR